MIVYFMSNQYFSAINIAVVEVGNKADGSVIEESEKRGGKHVLQSFCITIDWLV